MMFMPNIPTPVLNGKVCWNVIDENNSWELQQNIFTGHCRIIDSNGIRRVWGDFNAMEAVFIRMSNADVDIGG